MVLRVCISIPARSLKELCSMLREAEGLGADLIEIRLDYMGADLLENMPGLRETIRTCSVPLIATNRHRGQGGVCVLDENLRIKSLLEAAEIGFKYVDVELDTPGLRDVIGQIKARGAEVIVSHHIFTHTPPDRELREIVGRQIEAGADICKVATMARDPLDSIRCLVFTYKMSRKVKLVCLAMGEMGLLSRVLAPAFGALFTYASLGKGFETAPGQITIGEIKEIYRRMMLE